MDGSRKTDYRYYAFISYSRKDIPWAKWLQRKLQNYRLPAKLVKEHADLPKKIFPVFRDQQDLSGIVLEEALQKALEDSQYLIVLCSPNSAASFYVNLEVQYFLSLGRGNRIIPLIIDGIPFSKDPTKECFPEALRGITPELLGINVTEHGRRRAFLRVVATLLRIHHDEIIRRDGVRLALKRSAAAAAAIVLAAAGFWALWFNTPHIQYYNAYITRNEIPQGIFPLSESQRGNAGDCFRITTLQGKVIRLENVNSLDTVINPVVSTSLSDHPRQEFTGFDDRGRPTEIELYDDHGMLIQRKVLRYNHAGNQIIIDFQQTGADWGQAMAANLTSGMSDDSTNTRKSEIIRQVNTYDENGLLVRCMYYRDTLGGAACDSSGVYGKEFVYTDLGQVARIINLDEKGQMHNCSYGYAMEAFTYDETGAVASVTYYAADGSRAYGANGCSATVYVSDEETGNILYVQQLDAADAPSHNALGVSRTDYTYDSQGFLISRKQYDAAGQPTYDRYGIHEYAMEYDPEYGRVRRYTMLDTDGKPCYCTYGFAIAEVIWDSQGRELEDWMYNPQGELCLHKELGISGAVYTYDEKGFQNACYYYDNQRQPAECSFGYVSLHYTLNDNDQVVRTEYRDAQGNPAHPQGNIAATVYSHDVYGNTVQTQYVDEEGNPTASAYGICSVVYTYEDGNQVSERYYGENGQPVQSTKGFHEMRMAYDEKGNCISWDYYDTQGVMTCWQDGYARLEQDYDEYGNITTLRYYDENGQPMVIPEGYFELRCDYDDRGNCIRQSRYDTGGQLICDSNGIAVMEFDHDIHGRIIDQRCYDEKGQPTLNADGFFRKRSAYDETGNVVFEAWYGTDGNLTCLSGGYAVREKEYDTLGNLSSTRFYNEKVQPILDEGGRHEIRSEYDEMGNVIRQWYYGTDGAPIVINGGYAMVEWDHNIRGEVTELRLFDENGQPTLHTDGYHRFRTAYDEHGNQTYGAWYDTAGNLVCRSGGYAIQEQAFDDHGNVVSIRYYNEQVEPVLIGDGYYAVQNEYDEDFNLIRQWYYGTDGKLILTNMGYAMIDMDYNARGQMTAFRQYDPELRLVAQTFLDPNGVHLVERRVYDESGRVVAMRVFDLYGNPETGPYGFHENRGDYDIFGNPIRESYYDIQGNLICRDGGYAIIEWDYDFYGRIIAQRCYDEKGKPTLIDSGYFEVRTEYDRNGNVSAIYLYDTEGKLLDTVQP